MKGKRFLLLVAALAAFTLIFPLACKFAADADDAKPDAVKVTKDAKEKEAQRAKPKIIESAGGDAGQYPATQGYSEIAEAAVKSVVNVSATQKPRRQRETSPYYNDPFFEYFFGPQSPHQMPPNQRERALGSGVIVSADGYLLTNNHVVENADELTVTLYDGRTLPAEVVGTDPKSDVAVLKIKADDLIPMKLGQSSELRLGEVVLAIGNPFGLSHTVTQGIVSALGRARVGIADYEDFIQTDAAINPGNSGGALINTRGELVGINTAIASRTGGYQGVGFAIPIDMARNIMDSLVQYGYVERGYLGVIIQDVDTKMAEYFGMDRPNGALIGDLLDDGPAGKAGLKRGDVVVTFDGKPVTDSAHLRNMVSQTPIGKKVELEILRDDRRETLTVEVSRHPEDEGKTPALRRTGDDREEEDAGLPAGLTVSALSPQIRARFNIPHNIDGILIVRVKPTGAAAQAGLHPGDVIIEVNRRAVTQIPELRRLLEDDTHDNALLLIYREGRTLFMTMPLH